MNEYIPELAKRNLVDWPTLAIGLNNGWINKDAVSEHAFKLLTWQINRAYRIICLHENRCPQTQPPRTA
jgi:hypothetical protein